MKQGRTLQELAGELQRQKVAKRDFVAPTRRIIVKEREKRVFVDMENIGSFPMLSLAEEQMASKLGIPKKYFDRMRTEAPELLENNVNHWLRTGEEKLMIRTMDNNARAVLSNRYRTLDNAELAEAVLPELKDMEVKIESCDITDSRLYIKAITDKMTAELSVGDVVQAGIVISNSEVGLGSVRIEPLLYRLRCLNGLISVDHRMRKYHVGRGDNDDTMREYFADETKVQDDRAFWMKVRDIVRGSLKADIFKNMVDKLRASAQDAIIAKPIEVIEVVQERFQLVEPERESVLEHLIRSGDLNRFGLINAITRASQDVQSYDRATELERLGGEILELSGKSWEQIANAVR